MHALSPPCFLDDAENVVRREASSYRGSCRIRNLLCGDRRVCKFALGWTARDVQLDLGEFFIFVTRWKHSKLRELHQTLHASWIRKRRKVGNSSFRASLTFPKNSSTNQHRARTCCCSPVAYFTSKSRPSCVGPLFSGRVHVVWWWWRRRMQINFDPNPFCFYRGGLQRSDCIQVCCLHVTDRRTGSERPLSWWFRVTGFPSFRAGVWRMLAIVAKGPPTLSLGHCLSARHILNLIWIWRGRNFRTISSFKIENLKSRKFFS